MSPFLFIYSASSSPFSCACGYWRADIGPVQARRRDPVDAALNFTLFSFAMSSVKSWLTNLSRLELAVRKLRSGREIYTGIFPDPSAPLRALAARIPIEDPLQAALVAEDEYWWSSQTDSQDAKSPIAPSPLTSIPPSSIDSDSDYILSRPASPPVPFSTPSLCSPSPSCSARAGSPSDPSGSFAAGPSSAAGTSSANPPKRRKRKKTNNDKDSRKTRRGAARRNAPPTERVPHAHLVKLHDATPEVLEAALAILKGMPVTTTVYTGKRVAALKEGQVWTREELDDAGFEEFHWDGWCVSMFFFTPNVADHLMRSTPYVILDDARRIVGVLAGRPRHIGVGPDSYQQAVTEASEVIQAARDELLFTEADLIHRRGDFPARMFGVSHGGGQTVCFLRPLPKAAY